MLSKHLAYITPAVLTWAIDRSGLDRAELAKQVKVKANILEAWEKGLASPQMNKALKIAEVLHIPFGYFYLSEPPPDTVPIPDLRRLPDTPALPNSPEFLDVLYQAMSQHDWYRAYMADLGSAPLPFVSKFTARDSVEIIARDINAVLGMDNALRRDASNWSNYLTKLSQRAETAGVIVMRRAVVGSGRRKLDRIEFQGFAVSDPLAPLVFVNGQDFEAPKIFTLIHELAHIWIGQSGISRIDETSEKPSIEVEDFCNAIAAEALVPKDEFNAKWTGNADFAHINGLARYFLVSGRVIARRARELNKINIPTFISLLAEIRKHEKPKAKPKGNSGNFYTTLDARNSPKLVESVVADVRREGTMYRDAARLLSMKVSTVAKMVEGPNSS